MAGVIVSTPKLNHLTRGKKPNSFVVLDISDAQRSERGSVQRSREQTREREVRHLKGPR